MILVLNNGIKVIVIFGEEFEKGFCNMAEGLYEYIEISDLKDMLQKSGDLYGDNIAYKIKRNGEYITFSHKEIRKMINGLGTSLINMGLKGKRIAVIGENRYEWEIAYLAIACGTGIVVPLDKSLPENELRNLIERSGIEAIFYTKKYEDSLIKMKHECIGKLKHLINMDLDMHTDGIYSEMELVQYGKNLVEDGNRDFVDAKIDAEKMGVMLFTSGTTSASKIVALSHKNICSNLMDIASVLDINDQDVFLSFLPLHHVFECTVGFLFSLYKGAQTVFADGIRHIVENMNEYHVTVMASVPAIYERIFKIISKQLENKNLRENILKLEEEHKESSMEEKKKVFAEIHEMLGGNVRLLISGAASLDPTIEGKYRKLGLNMVQGYGLTETSPVVAVGNKIFNRVGSVGKTVPHVKAKIVNADKDGMGELVVSGPSIMLEYYQNEEATKDALRDGWFYTGDLAKIDDDGYIFICGRKKSVIVLKNGKNIFPEEMENLLNRIEGVEESFIYGMPVSEDPNDLKIFAEVVYNEDIVMKAYKVEDFDGIYDAIFQKVKEINKTMPPYKAIRGITLTKEALIKTTTGKIKRNENLKKVLKNYEVK